MFADLDEKNAASSAEESKQFATNEKYRTAVVKVDVADAGEVQAMVNFVVREFGRLDYAVNSAGVSQDYLSAPVRTC